MLIYDDFQVCYIFPHLYISQTDTRLNDFINDAVIPVVV